MTENTLRTCERVLKQFTENGNDIETSENLVKTNIKNSTITFMLVNSISNPSETYLFARYNSDDKVGYEYYDNPERQSLEDFVSDILSS